MYYPYLRGKAHELLAITRTAPQMATSGKVVPILEPVREKIARLETAVKVATDAGASVIIITNPQVGELAGSTNALSRSNLGPALQANPQTIPGFIVEPTTRASHINAFLRRYHNRDICVVHNAISGDSANVVTSLNLFPQHITHVLSDTAVPQGYRRSLTTGSKVMLQDRFRPMPRNADYPPEDFFSDSHLTFSAEGYNGFSDYSIVGKGFREQGGAAHAVAIHHVYKKSSTDEVWIKHFLSDDMDGPTDPGGKFRQALRKLARFSRSDSFSSSTVACQEFLDLHARGHFPGLGVVKQLSIRHHLELAALIL
jgi:hypothetical protein